MKIWLIADFLMADLLYSGYLFFSVNSARLLSDCRGIATLFFSVGSARLLSGCCCIITLFFSFDLLALTQRLFRNKSIRIDREILFNLFVVFTELQFKK